VFRRAASGRFLLGDSTLRFRLGLWVNRGTRFARSQRSVPGHRPINDRRELSTVILHLRFERRDAHLSCSKLRAITFEHA
jgi:hypothetical protein